MAGAESAHPGIELHLIGPLQSNKVREAVGLFDVIETVDRPKLARAIAEEMARVSKRPRSSCRSTPARNRKRRASPPARRGPSWRCVAKPSAFPSKG